MELLKSLKNKTKSYEVPFKHFELNEPLTHKTITEICQANITDPKKENLNLLNVTSINKFLNKKYSIIINCAAMARMTECEKKPNKAFQANVIGTLNLVKAINKYKKNIRLIHISSDAVYPSTNGNYSEINQQYFPDHVGQWWLNLTSVYGVSSELLITVGHGEMAMLELNVSSTEITADERVYVNTTRVDVRGNRIAVVLPAENWTKIADGQLTPGAPAIWDPQLLRPYLYDRSKV